MLKMLELWLFLEGVFGLWPPGRGKPGGETVLAFPWKRTETRREFIPCSKCSKILLKKGT